MLEEQSGGARLGSRLLSCPRSLRSTMLNSHTSVLLHVASSPSLPIMELATTSYFPSFPMGGERCKFFEAGTVCSVFVQHLVFWGAVLCLGLLGATTL